EGEIRRNVTELLSWVGLADELRSLPPTLSGGQQQRVAIARAVVGRPELLLADEPTGNVDDVIAVRLMYLFEELNRLGTTVIIATHNEGLVDRFDHPQIRIAEGRVGLVERGGAGGGMSLPPGLRPRCRPAGAGRCGGRAAL